MGKHHSHPEIIKRFKRATGHLQSVIVMMQEERDCLTLAQQLSAVEKAISQAKKTLIKDHIDHRLEDSGGKRGGAGSISELKEITKYL